MNSLRPDDLVYLEDDKEREEYIMNDRGKIYVGQYRKARGRPWAYGQFDDAVLPAAVYILEMTGANLAHSERGNPVRVVRAISAGVSPYCFAYTCSHCSGISKYITYMFYGYRYRGYDFLKVGLCAKNNTLYPNTAINLFQNKSKLIPGNILVIHLQIILRHSQIPITI